MPTFIARVLIAVALALGLPATATAAGPADAIETVVQRVDSTVTVSSGEGLVAWTTEDPGAETKGPSRSTFGVWTLRDGAPVRVATLGGPCCDTYVDRVDVGTSADGVPVAVVALIVEARGALETTLIRLDTGAARAFAPPARPAYLGGAAVDAGQLYFTVAARGSHGTSSLWRAPITGLSRGRAERLATARRGELWFGLLADEGKVAFDGERRFRRRGAPYRQSGLLFGDPRRLRRKGFATRKAAREHAHRPPPLVAGFTARPAGLVTIGARRRCPVAAFTPLRDDAAPRRLELGFSRCSHTGESTIAFDSVGGRFFARGYDSAGTLSLGFTGALAPGQPSTNASS